MTTAHEPQRFPDRRGWLRNRRAVVLDERGITVERWLGEAVFIGWRQVTALQWMRADTVVLHALGRRFRFGPGVDQLPVLAERIVQEVRTRAARAGGMAVSAAQVRRWLHGYTEAVADPVQYVNQANRQHPGCFKAAALLGLPLGLGMWYSVWTRMPAARWDSDLLQMLALVLCMGSALAMVVVTDALLLWSGRRSLRRCRVAADEQRVAVAVGKQPERSFDWSQILGISESARQYVVHVRDQADVRIPRYEGFKPVIDAMHAVLERHPWFGADDQFVPDTALSPAEDDPQTEGIDRGLSLAESEKADA